MDDYAIPMPVPEPVEVSRCLWAPGAAPAATALRDALCAFADAQSLGAYEALWFGTIARRAAETPWDGRHPAFCWRPAAGEPRLWVRCYLFESVMLARTRGAMLMAACGARPPGHPESAADYAAAAAAYGFAADTLAAWANLPAHGICPTLTVQENSSCARLAAALHHAARLSDGDAAASWMGVHALCAAHGDAGIRPVGLALRRVGLSAHASACAAAAESAAEKNDYPNAAALAGRAAEDALASGASDRHRAYARRAETLRFALARVWPGIKEPPFASSMLPAASELPPHGGRYPDIERVV
jgi:hypothetical protein